MSSDYEEYRGKCLEMSQALVDKNPTLRLVRGHYICPFDGAEPHWWCEDNDGNIIDPTVKQFKSNGVGAEYEEFDGNVECCECGKKIKEDDAQFAGNYVICSTKCHMSLVGVTN